MAFQDLLHAKKNRIENERLSQLVEELGALEYAEVQKKTEEAKKMLDDLKTYIGIVLGVEMLEYYDKNFLSGNNESRTREKIVHLKLAMKQVDNIGAKLNI